MLVPTGDVVVLPDLDDLVVLPPEEHRDVDVHPPTAGGQVTPKAWMGALDANTNRNTIHLFDQILDRAPQVRGSIPPAVDDHGEVGGDVAAPAHEIVYGATVLR